MRSSCPPRFILSHSFNNNAMRAPIISLGLAALVATTSVVSAETTIAVLEFGPGGSVHRTTSSSTESNSAAVSSFWNALHRPLKSSPTQHAGMSVVPDMFTRADAGIVIGLQGVSLKSMPTATSLGEEATEDNVVGLIHVPGQATADLMKRASSKDVELIAKEDMGRRLHSIAENAVGGALEGMKALTLAVENDNAAAVADEQLRRMLKTLKKQADSNGKTVVVHLVMDSTRRRLDEANQDGENQNQNNNNDYSNYRTMYEIQTFNLYLWTAVGLVVIVFMIMGAFVDMPLMPDTLLYGETKMAD
mmetsp:Transcript_18296/g.39319  ORF Transcript_18296/g.39319 Transcript_18296/m.39319 type:complete len:305 (-) Transcript_18296:80-994(-)